jgi:hypothetical protein
MVPTIGVMIGVYILLRCCELYGSAPARFSSPFWHVCVKVAATLCFFVTLLCILGLLLESIGHLLRTAAL